MARPGRVRLVARHRADGLLLGAVGRSAERELAVERPDASAATRARREVRAALRQRPHRAVLAGRRRRRRSPTTPRPRGRAPGSCSCSTRPIRSSGGRPNLLFSRAGLARRTAGRRDRTASMRWYPIITFWQVAADMTNALGRSGRTRPQLRRIGARRLGRRWPRPTGGRPRTPSASDWRSRKSQANDGPEY